MLGLRNKVETILIESNVMTQEDVKSLQSKSVANGKPFLALLLKTGKITEEKLQDLLAQRLNIKKIDLSKFQLSMDILKILPPQLCRKYSLIPVAKSKGRKLVVAFADPGDYEALDNVTAVAQMQVEPVVATWSAVEQAINKNYAPQKEAKKMDIKKITADMASDMAKEVVEEKAALIIDDAQSMSANDGPVIGFVNGILAEAIKAGVSDIHIEPYEKRLRIRYRIDGTLIDKVEPPQMQHPLL